MRIINNMIEPVSPDAVRYYQDLKPYGFAKAAEKYTLYMDGLLEKRRSEAELEALRKIPLKKTDQKKIWLESYDFHVSNFEQSIRAAIFANYSRKDPLSRFSLERIPAHVFVPRELFLQIIEEIPEPPDAISATEYRKQETAIRKRIDSANKKILESRSNDLILNGFFMPEGFFETWFSRQRYVIDDVGPRGIRLDFCSDDEKKAFQIAHVASARISGKAQYNGFVPR